MNPEEMAEDMTVSDWLAVMHTLQVNGFQVTPPYYTLMGDELADWFNDKITGLFCEVAEMADEIGWKSWITPRGWYNRDQVISEIADQMHFQAHILNAVGCTGEELTAVLKAKVQKNYERQAQEEGDDIRKRRCSKCGRSLDDVGTITEADEWDSNGRPVHSVTKCAACGTVKETQ